MFKCNNCFSCCYSNVISTLRFDLRATQVLAPVKQLVSIPAPRFLSTPTSQLLQFTVPRLRVAHAIYTPQPPNAPNRVTTLDKVHYRSQIECRDLEPFNVHPQIVDL
jgi:hypothetical protein